MMRKGVQTTYRSPDGREQQLYPDEAKRIEILERLGWRRVATAEPEAPPAPAKPASTKGKGAKAPESPALSETPPAGFLGSLELSEQQADALTLAGLDTPEALRETEDDVILALPGIGPATLETLRAASKE